MGSADSVVWRFPSSQAGFWWSSLGHSCSHLERPNMTRIWEHLIFVDEIKKHGCSKGSPIALWVFWWFGRSIWPARKWDKWRVWSKMKKLKKLKLHLMCLQRLMSWRWPAMKNFIPHVGSAALGRFGMWTGDSTNISFRKLWQRGVWAEGKAVEFLWFSHVSSIWSSFVCLGLPPLPRKLPQSWPGKG